MLQRLEAQLSFLGPSIILFGLRQDVLDDAKQRILLQRVIVNLLGLQDRLPALDRRRLPGGAGSKFVARRPHW